jgi:hypothetical protein
VDLETFLQQLTFDPSNPDMPKKFEDLRERYAQSVSRSKPDIAYTKGLRLRVQNELDSTLKERGYVQ